MTICIARLSVVAWLALWSTFAAPAQPKEIIGYFPSWKWRVHGNNLTPDRIPYQKLTVINYAFFSPRPDGTIAGRDSVGDVANLRGSGNKAGPKETLTDLAHCSGTRVVLSIGGWEDSNNFPAVAASRREMFARSCLDQVRGFGFDGIDIDWEFPGYADHYGTPADRQNFTILLQTLRDSLDTYGESTGRHYLLTAALPSDPIRAGEIEVKKVAEILDMLNLMTYDFTGPWDPRANHNAPLYAAAGADTGRCMDATFRLYHEFYGVPASKINLGVPFYGQSYTNCTELNSRHSGSDTLHFPKEGAFYNTIAGVMKNFTRCWDNRAKVPYLVSTSWNMLVSYDDEESVGYKARYVRDRKAGGVIIWEITGDYMPDGTTPLLDVIYGVFDGVNHIRK